eukprot:jgi/Mesvir1/19259/Mv10340-RA.1
MSCHTQHAVLQLLPGSSIRNGLARERTSVLASGAWARCPVGLTKRGGSATPACTFASKRGYSLSSKSLCYGFCRTISHARPQRVTVAVASKTASDVYWTVRQKTSSSPSVELRPGEEIVFGRTEETADIGLNVKTVSGKHARLEVEDDGSLMITDLGSTNGTRVRKGSFDVTLSAKRPVRLAPGSIITFADPDDPRCVFVVEQVGKKKEVVAEENVPQVTMRENRYLEQSTSMDITIVGPRYSPRDVEVGAKIGEGSFGLVFEGRLYEDDADEEGRRVVLKRTKERVVGAQEMCLLEMQLNERIRQHAPNTCASFLGSVLVTPEEAGEIYRKQLNAGLWLMWEYEGRTTLDNLLAKRDFEALLGKSFGLRSASKSEVIRTATRQLLEALVALHNERLVHRDVKPENILVAEPEVGPARLKLLDLGACADMKTGVNYVKGYCPRDPRYCPPECDAMMAEREEGAPILIPGVGGEEPAPKAVLDAVWKESIPDSFDVYSTGIVFMQMAVAPLRTDAGLQKFNDELRSCRYDINAWKFVTKLNKKDLEVLDEKNGAGWELAGMLLKQNPPRSATQALQARFFK